MGVFAQKRLWHLSDFHIGGGYCTVASMASLAGVVVFTKVLHFPSGCIVVGRCHRTELHEKLTTKFLICVGSRRFGGGKNSITNSGCSRKLGSLI